MYTHLKPTLFVLVCFDFITLYAVTSHGSSTSDPTDLKHVTSFPSLQTKSEIILWRNAKRDSEAQKLEFDQAKQHLEEFVGVLKSFVTKKSFHNVRFEQLAHMLRSNLYEVADWVGILPFRKYISDQLRHARNLFFSMCHAAEVYKFYPHQEGAHLLIRTVSYMNLRLMTLGDSRGAPEFQRPLFNKTVAFSSLYLDFLEQSAMEVDMTYELRQLFEEQLRDAQDRVKILTG